MPYPSPDDPNYCPGSRTVIDDYDHDVLWHRCEGCGRLIAAMGNTGRFFPHKTTPGRRGDAVQEGLTAAGYNRRDRFVAPVYADEGPCGEAAEEAVAEGAG